MQKMKQIMLAVLIFVLAGAGVLGAFLIFNKKETAPTGNKADVSWYTEDGKEFIITTVDELYGLVKLSEYYNFSGQTIKLGADIVVNEGSAEEWEEKAPSLRWYPIDGFAGTFDGQGHTISGLYGYAVDTVMGLFSNTKMNSIIKDFKVLNSFFKVDGLKPVGSIVSNGCGTFDKLYSDAIVTSNGENAGGIIGNANDDGTVSATAKASKITNCWFDGEIRMTTKTGRYGGGIVGRVFGGTLNIAHCLNSGTISAESTETNGLYVGGIFGALTYTNFSGAVTLEDTLNVGKIDVKKATATGSIAGGTLANSSMIIKDTYTTEQSYTEVCSYQKSSTTGGVPMMNTDFIQGKEWYSWTTLNYDQYWTVTKDSTPILRCFADEVIDTTGLAKAYSFDWYNQYAQESIIDSVEDLYGFALMSYSDTFQNKVIKLGADITVNEGKATQWASGKKLPDNCWLPIGRTPAFQGTFDGDGHTISGVYGTTAAPFMGLFGWVGNNAQMKNFRLTNSLFELTSTSASALGSITGRLEGKLDTIYSDAIVSTVGVNVGGIAGYKLTDIESSVTNCWYDGTMNLIGDSAKNVGGMMGRLINGTITIDNCLFSGNINVGGKLRTANTGGFIGNIAAGTVTVKNSLNSGEFILKEAEKMYAVGRVFGQVADSENITITLDNSYFTRKGLSEAYWYYCAGKKPTVIGGVELKEEKDILGYSGYRTTGLDFSKYWSVVVKEDATPILKSFAKKSPSVARLEKTFDKSWYSHDKTTYVLSDAKDLYGFLYLSNSKIDFTGKTVKLGNDIVVHAGSAAEWVNGTNLPDKVYNWSGIGKHTNFQGTFDGQGHTISGLYGTADTSFMGLFGWVGTEGTVKNVRLANTFFESTVEDSAAIGSIAGRLEGDIHTVYSDAIIKTKSALNGGIAGYKLTADTKSSITNSWYAGTMYMVGNDSKHSGGIVGRVIGGELELNSCLFTGKISISGETRSANTGGFAGNVNGTLIIKNCLNNGVFEVTEAEKMNSTCRVIGQVSNVDTANVLMENTYFTNKGDNGTWFWYNTGDKATIKGGAELKEEEDILGNNGFTTTTLDFENYWTIVVNADGAPILKSFASSVPSVAGLTKNFDTSWYDESKDTYVLTDREDLYGLVYLSNSNIKFTGKTITLGNNIAVNTSGTAAEWLAGSVPIYKWAPISEYGTFEGTFDGKGHTISGIYATEHADFMGLFGRIGTSSMIKNVRLENSYFERSTDGGEALGSIVGRCDGDLHSVYSDAIIKSAKSLTGGLAGYKNTTSTTKITNSWYAGTMLLTSKYNGGLIGKTINGPLEIDNCLFSGEIQLSEISGNSRIGGFVGHATTDVTITSSLNSGEFIDVEGKEPSGVGRVVGQNDAVITTAKVYIVNKGYGGTSLWYSPGKEEGTTPVIVKVADILGEYGYHFTKLNFKKYWTTVLDNAATEADESGAPILQSFASVINPIPTPPAHADISWYDEKETEYTIYDKHDLFGLVYLSGTGVTFEGKTITIADEVDEIVVNTGTVAEWLDGTVSPEYNWEPIGNRYAFAGTFDGNGKTISGIYATEYANFMGLFGRIGTGSAIKNLRLGNSYFERTAEGGEALGSIVGRCDGDLHSVYSNATIKSAQTLTGGLAGYKNTASTTKITNSWYDGTMILTSKYNGGLIGKTINGPLEIDNCLFSGEIHLSGIAGNSRIGGFVGHTSADVTITNSLNSGEFFNEDGATLSGIGRVAGQNDEVITTEKVYIVDKGFSGSSLWYSPGTEEGTKPEVIQEPDILGEYGYYFTKLDFEKYWTTVLDNTATAEDESGAPILQTFAPVINEIPTPPSYADISWYDENESDYTIYDRADLLGLSYLSKTGITFKDKTITIADSVDEIVINAGTVEEWINGTVTPEYNWEPIGKRYPFAGTFDGNGKTISGLYIDTDAQGGGLFRSTAVGSTIKNLRLENSYIHTTAERAGSVVGSLGGNLINVYSSANVNSSANFSGGLAGQIFSSDNVNITNCWYDGSLNAQSNAGGIVGIITSGTIHMQNCLNSGSVTIPSNKDTAGGLVGRTGTSSVEWDYSGTSDVTLTIKECLNTGDITGRNNIGSAIGWKQKGTVNVELVYATKTSDGASADGLGVGGGNLNSGSVIMVETSDITGVFAYFNTKLDFKDDWALIKDGTPVLKYFAGETLDVPQAPEGADISWLDNANASCTISDKADLYGFAYLSGLGFTFEGKIINLDADVTVNEKTVAEWKSSNYANLKTWTPITNFAGTFNGNNHSINGIYVNSTEQGAALFKNTVAGSTIKNLKVENSYINTTAERAGSVVGSLGGNLINVYSSANVNSSIDYAGGLVGQIFSSGNVNVTNCWFDGSVNAKSNSGGIVGIITSGTITMQNCLNSGAIITSRDSTGGLVGRTGTSAVEWDYSGTSTVSLTMNSCLNRGTITGRNNIGSAIGWPQKGTLVIENVYATKTSDGASTDNVGIGSLTTDTRITMVNLADVTVAGTVTETVVRTTLSGLNFKNIWAIGKDGAPALQWAADLGFDTSWYDETVATYKISTAEELYGVEYLSSIGVGFEGKTINLDADITVNEKTVAEWKTNNYANLKTWTPIENFAGILNGNSYSIKGIYVNSTELGAAFIKNTVSGSTIKNLKFENSYINSTKDIAGSVVASCGGNMENVYSSATVNTTGNYSGGLIGQIFSTGNVNIKNCWFAGTMNAKSNSGGIVGLVSNGTIVIENCLNTGSVTTTNDSVGGFFGRTFTSGQEWVLSGSGTINLTIKQCLNAGVIKGRNNVGSAIGWKQKGTVKVESFYATETSTGASTNGVLIGAGDLNGGSVTAVKLADITVAGSVKEADLISKLNALDFNITWGIGANNTPELSWVNNLNTDTRWYDETKDDYTISTQKELYGLASLCESGVTFQGKTINLDADITVNAGTVDEWKTKSFANLKAWTPIKNFAGIFNGNNHSIKGIYVNSTEQGAALFKNTLVGSTIKNLKLENSYINTTAERAGSVVGSLGGNLVNVYSSANVNSTIDYAGGLVAQIFSSGNVNITNCWFDGSVNAKSNAGGIVGIITSGTITMQNCLNSGAITTSRDSTGGLVGRTGTSSVEWGYSGTSPVTLTMNACLNRGTITGRNNIGSAIGWPQKGSLVIENVYATKTSDGASVDNVGIGSLTDDTRVSMVDLADIKVEGSVTANNVKNTLSGLDFNTIWKIGDDGIPELQMPSTTTTASLFKRVAMAIKDFITN